MHRIVAFTGPMGGGKSTAADALQTYIPGAARTPFAYALKLDVADVMSEYWPELRRYSPARRIDWVNANKQILRPLLQGLGVSVRELANEDHWVERVMDRMDQLEESGVYGDDPLFIIDDLRFPNEEFFVHASGGLVLRVDAPEWVRRERLGLRSDEFAAYSHDQSESLFDELPYDAWVDGGACRYDMGNATIDAYLSATHQAARPKPPEEHAHGTECLSW